MGCTPAGHKTFLVVCNIGLLFLGLGILSLGVKMKDALEVFNLEAVPLLMNSVKAIVATGFFITVTGGSGFSGACYEIVWLLPVHAGALGFIVVMEFSLGITLMVIKNSIEVALKEVECGYTCHNVVNYVVMKLASATAGTMLTVIIMEGLMIYSAVQLYFYLQNKPKDTAPAAAAAGPTVVVQNVQMQNMAPPQPQIVMPAPAPQQPQYAPQQPQYAPQQPQYAPQQPQYAPQQPQYAPQPAQQPQYAPQPPQYAPQPYTEPPSYSQLPQQPPCQTQPHIEATVSLNPPVVPPLDTSTLTRKPKLLQD